MKNFIKISSIIKECPEEILRKWAIVLNILVEQILDMLNG
jgi:hypothetical protein